MMARNTSPTFTAAQKIVIVKPMDVEESSNMLLSHLALDQNRSAPTLEEQGIARKLCAELGGLPFAITQIGAFVLNGGCELDEVLDLFKARDTKVFFEDGQELSDPHYGHTLSSVWDVTLAKFDEPTRTLLEIVAFLDPSSITQEMLQFPEQLGLDTPKLSLLRGLGR